MNDQTLLLRQVHPNFFPDGEVSSQAFFPFPKDDGKLSVYDGDQIAAEDSHRHYTGDLGLQSAGVWAVNGEEVGSVGLAFRPDPVEGNPAHAVVDFGVLAEKECRKLAKRLRKLAVDRGNLYRAA
ncbi:MULTISPECIES: hypothetical protein [Burkholderia]|uniref:hypothetical protein n=1 Tax=Burkholderia TaxID=32008 RepID=UPI000975E943|nr:MULTISPECIES: hypothetical protein [pseudomallei group]MCS3400805.1 hypothetical protein [Burkholderia thailandensis]QIO13412.1 hypothetical protein G9462_16310 [Burkholderia thailandensis]CAJ3291647.1 Uncharacterised protein [Burkholderia pseudomallei]CAJ9426242.1 Uncharacterised protein [Burkholderia pseudomallei]VBS85653.1 Uncharacterised protein [Burkholderia pseudomallei]